jgi:alkyldihydroxyacetonephosphate synthase
MLAGRRYPLTTSRSLTEEVYVLDRRSHRDGSSQTPSETSPAARASGGAPVDAWPPLAKTRVRASLPPPAAIAEPASLDELRETLLRFATAGLPIIPVGGASNVVGALASARPVAFVSLRRLDRILAVDAHNCMVRCEAGVLGGDLEERLQHEGLTLGHYPQSLYQSTVGGWIATGAMGTFSGRYGGIESLLLGVDVMLADGTLVEVPAHPRFAAGPPLAHLFVGAEGTFGVVVAATLRVARVPAQREVQGWAVPALGPAVEVLRDLIQGGVRPAVLRLYDADDGATLIRQGGGPSGWLPLLVGFDGQAEIVKHELHVVASALAELGAQALPGVGDTWLERRFDPPAFLRAGEQPGQLADAIDVTAWWSTLEAGYLSIREAVLAAGASSCRAHFSHFYQQGASIYFVFSISAENDTAALRHYSAIWDAAMLTCRQLKIVPVHHHGVGEVRQRWLRPFLGSSAELLDRLRGALDPRHVLNPDRLGGGSQSVLSLAMHSEGEPT